ncbi:MAG: hypothetical protein PHC62_11530, partial [Candidatus Izemoplasmatales bacterium]|nr:hypothetical protein [Candidatus Izemoplasmatales bacterium]
KALFGQIEAVDTLQEITGNETSSRLWLQDAIVIDDFVYLFPLLVKDESTAFYVASVNVIKAPIVDGLIDYKNATYLSSPLYIKTPSGGDLYFGAGILDNRDIDGYIYIYGYLDLDGRKLTVARTTAENISNFNEWLFYNGTSFSDNPLDSAPFLDSVSPELSVTYMTSGIYQGKYMLVAMEGTTSGRVSYSVGESPVGPFSEFHLLYETSESEDLKSAFTYNAKMHPILSTPEAFLISYNVNTTSISALGNTEIYYPRFIIVTEVKAPKGE